MNRYASPLLMLVILGFVLLGWNSPADPTDREVPRMSIDELKGMLDSKDHIAVDVRTGKDWSSSEFKIKGAVREDPKAFDSWASKFPKDKKIILYCA